MAGSTLLTIDMITAEAVRLFKNTNLFIMNIDTQYDPAFAVDGAKIGQSLRIRLPNDYTVRHGAAMQIQGTNEQYTTLTVSSLYGVDVGFTTTERTMSLDNYNEIVLQPMLNDLVGDVAATVMEGSEGGVSNFVSNVDASAALNAVSATGAIIDPTMQTFLLGNATLSNVPTPGNDRRIVLDPTSNALAVSQLAGLLNPATEISAQFRSGQMKNGLGYERWFEDQTVIKHTTGTFSSGGTVNGGSQTTAVTGGNITVNAITGTLKQGDIVTFAGVNSVNRTTKRTNGTLQQFVVTADVATTGTSIPIYPAMIPPDSVTGANVQYQTVTASPINGAAMKLVTQSGEVYRKTLAYTQKAVTMATADLVMPSKAVQEAGRATYDGISIRMLTPYLPMSDQLATRMDVLFGFKYIRPEWLAVIAGKV
jgi:hypothetical protein